MLEIRLILKTLKKQYKVYFVYFIGIISVISLLIMYVNFMSTVISSFKDSQDIKVITMKITSVGIMLLVSLFLLFIVVYGNKMMRKAKAKEYGLLKLYGVTNKKLFQLIFLEQIFIIIISFIISLIIGTILTFVLVFTSNMFIKEYIAEGFRISLSLINYLLIFILLIVISFITSFLNYKAVRKNDIVTLLKEENNLKPAKEISTKEFIFYLINVIILYTLMVIIVNNQMNLLNIDEVFILIFSWCFGIYFLYKICAYVFIKVLPRKLLYKKENLFTFALITRKMSSNIKSMTFVTIFLVFLFSLIFIGTYISGYGKLMYQQDDIILEEDYNIFSGTYQGKDYTIPYVSYFPYSPPIFSDQYEDGEYVEHGIYYYLSEKQVNTFLEENNFKKINLNKNETIAINPFDPSYSTYSLNLSGEGTFNDEGIEIGDTYTVKKNVNLDLANDSTYLIIPDENMNESPIYRDYENKQEVLQEYKNDYDLVKVRGFLDGYCVRSPGSFQAGESEDEESCLYTLLESDVNNYFKYEKMDINLDLEYGEFGLLGTQNYLGQSLENMTEVYNAHDPNKVAGKIVDIKDVYLSQFDSYTKSYIVVSDEQAKQDKYWYGDSTWGSHGYLEKTYLNFTQNEEAQAKAWGEANNNKEYKTIYIKSLEVKEGYMLNLVALSFTMYIAFVLLILLICILSLQSAIDSVENKKEFLKLKRINYSPQDLKRSINKITFMYFVVPFLIAAINIYIYMKPFIAFLKSTRFFSVLKYVNVNMAIGIIILLVIIYFLFFILINFAYKKIIEV